MNTLNPFAPKTHHFNNPLSLSFSSSYLPVKASSFSFTKPKIPKPQLAFLKPTLVSTITATALLFSGFFFNPKKAISAPVSPPPTVDINVKEVASEEDSEKPIEEGLLSNPSEVEILRNLLENCVKNKELVDAMSIIDKLIELEPDETEWYFLKSHLYVHNGELELAKLGFRKVVSKDPYHIEAYRGLVMAGSQDDSVDEMKEIKEKVEEGIGMCIKENKEGVVRDFKLLLAQIWVIEGKYDDALKVYQELVDEEPMDFRPYLCQGLIYTVLKKKDEAEKYFEKYRGLVPQEDPKARFEFMMVT